MHSRAGSGHCNYTGGGGGGRIRGYANQASKEVFGRRRRRRRRRKERILRKKLNCGFSTLEIAGRLKSVAPEI
jgi:hypothetical protein